jgi:hypothetical protein
VPSNPLYERVSLVPRATSDGPRDSPSGYLARIQTAIAFAGFEWARCRRAVTREERTAAPLLPDSPNTYPALIGRQCQPARIRNQTTLGGSRCHEFS